MGLLLALLLAQPVSATYCDGWGEGWVACWCDGKQCKAPPKPRCPPPEEPDWAGFQQGFTRACDWALKVRQKKMRMPYSVYHPTPKKEPPVAVLTSTKEKYIVADAADIMKADNIAADLRTRTGVLEIPREFEVALIQAAGNEKNPDKKKVLMAAVKVVRP